MKITQRLAEHPSRTKLRISEIERLIRIHRIIVPPLSRRTILRMCEEGILETAPQRSRTHLVYEDSFIDWVKSLDDKGP